MTVLRNVRSCVTHNHSVLHVTRLRRICMVHLVKSAPETRESVTKKSRVGADIEINAIEALTNAKLKVDRALDKASKTLHRLL